MASPKTPAVHLVLIRHAESLHNRDGDRVNVDSGLTELGWRQAHAVAGWLAERYRSDLLLSSSLMRARQTAEVIAARMNLPVVIDDGLAEAEFQYWDELPYNWNTPMDSWDDLWQPNPEEAPLYASFRARVHDSLARMVTGRPNATILALTHGGVIGTLMRSLFGGHHVAVSTANSGVTQFTWEMNHWRLIFHNSTAHLDALLSPRPTALANVQPAAPWTNSQNAAAILKHFQRVASVPLSEVAYPGERELRDFVRLADPRGDEQVLDVATGTGSVALAFAPHVASVLGVDLSPAMLERAEAVRSARRLANVHFRLGEIGVLPLQEASYDIITCHNLLHYASDLSDLFALLRRLLTAEGRLLVDEPLGSDDPVKRATLNAIALRRDPGVTQIWNAGEIEAALNAAGLRIIKSERYSLNRELDEWLSRAAADEATRNSVKLMFEAGVDADAAGLRSRRGRDGNIIFTESRIRLLARGQAQPA
jgi:broad specificity phosphatase PhoE/ubiquinone/menaquinone biosynthesis C-methylase UbiE